MASHPLSDSKTKGQWEMRKTKPQWQPKNLNPGSQKGSCTYQNKGMFYFITAAVTSPRAPSGQVQKQWASGRAGGLKPEAG